MEAHEEYVHDLAGLQCVYRRFESIHASERDPIEIRARTYLVCVMQMEYLLLMLSSWSIHVVKNEIWEGSQHKAHVPYKEVH
jgi:hypothetical protein